MTSSLADDIRYCPYCRSELELRLIAGRERPYCPACARPFFSDPKLAVAVIIYHEGQIVLQRRAIEPGIGLWSFPSGFVDRGEVVEEAALREVREETGLLVELERLVGLYSHRGHPVVLAVYQARVVGGQLQASEESSAVAWFPLDALPPLAFPHDLVILQDWQRTRHGTGLNDLQRHLEPYHLRREKQNKASGEDIPSE